MPKKNKLPAPELPPEEKEKLIEKVDEIVKNNIREKIGKI
jgi:hypothetical protein